jgi:hypothetical protein
VPIRLLAIVAETPSPNPAPTRIVDPQAVTPGLLGLVIFVALAVATFFLWRSMNKQLKRIDFDDGSGDSAAAPEDSEGTAAGRTEQSGSDARSSSPKANEANPQDPGRGRGEPSVDLRDKG